MTKYSIRHLFVLVTAFAVGSAFLGAEPLQTGLAAVFCFLGCGTIGVMAYMSVKEAITTLRQGARLAWLRLVRQSRWVHIGSFCFLTVLTIVVSNFVLETSVANGRWFIFFSWTFGPWGGIFCYLKFKPTARSS